MSERQCVLYLCTVSVVIWNLWFTTGLHETVSVQHVLALTYLVTSWKFQQMEEFMHKVWDDWCETVQKNTLKRLSTQNNYIYMHVLCVCCVSNFKLLVCVCVRVRACVWYLPLMWHRDRKVPSLNPGRSGRRIFFSRVNFVCWLLFGVRSTLVLPQWHVKDPGHSAKSTGGRLHLNTHTPLTQWSRSGLICCCPGIVYEPIWNRADYATVQA